MVRLLLVGSAFACATPAERFDRAAGEEKVAHGMIRGASFQHAVYAREDLAAAPVLHVYLEGDGSPARAWRNVPPDPTPESLLVLQLMLLDPNPSLLLGRPCHHAAGACSPLDWTSGRFSEEVVASLVSALETLRARYGTEALVLIGHSGGGTLAMLVAERVPQVRAVITIAGNLDLRAWSQHHGYAPLAGSIDPALRPPLPPRVAQLHLVGGRDDRVPPAVTEAAIARQPSARRWLLPEFDHACCWAQLWPHVLEQLEQRQIDAGPETP